MSIKHLLLLAFTATGLAVNAQTSPKSMVAAESIIISNDSTATMLDWFKLIEDQGIVLSYNTSNLNLNEKIDIKHGRFSIAQLLQILLYKYDFEINYSSSNKILLQIKGLKRFILKGYISDKDTTEPLEGCVIIFQTKSHRKFSAVADSLGKFTIKLPYDKYVMNASHIGYKFYTKELSLHKSSNLKIQMSPAVFPLEEVNVKTSSMTDEINYVGASSILSINENDPFAQINSLPGIVGTSVGGNLHVNGGQNDENLLLLDGVPVYHSHHNNTLLAQFNGEAVKKISFFDSFIPAQYEGRLSSVTDVKIKEGDDKSHHQTIGIDLPAASLTFNGPIVKNKITYMISGRHSWIDFMKDLFSDKESSSRTFNDITCKLRYQINSKVSIEGLLYRSRDEYNDSINGAVNHKILGWENTLYSISSQAQLPKKISNTTIVSYSEYKNSIFAPVININSPIYINEGMRNFMVKSNFSKKFDDYIDLSWGVSASREKYNLLASKDTVQNGYQKVTQLSSYLNYKIKVTDKLYGNVALNIVSYLPEKNSNFFSIQPRFTIRFIPNNSHLFSFDFSRMEQFYHNLCLGEIPLPTDLRMPSVNGFKPSSSLHCEIGWKYIQKNWRTSVSTYYKRRFDILGVRYNIVPDNDGWNRFIMKGNANSYGVKVHSMIQWNKWLLNLSYTYSRSHEWFKDYNNNKKCPTLHDIPHIFQCATSYMTGAQSYISVGGYIKSGTLENILNEDQSSLQLIYARHRRKINYKLDLNFASSINSKKQRVKFSYKIGLYNIIGNPKEDEIIDLYSIETKKHCLPYFSMNLKF